MVLVTASIKGWAFKKRARYLTPGLAHNYFVETALAQDLNGVPQARSKLPKDGWGNPFYWDFSKRLLVSAGKDERFQTHDDLYFSWIHSNCSREARNWIFVQKSPKGWDFSKLPPGIVWKPREFSLKTQSGLCPLPDLAGRDGLSGTDDDQRDIHYLEPGKPPQWRKVFEELKGKEEPGGQEKESL